MEDPFKIGLKAFFGVATGFGILLVTINVIQAIPQGIDNFIEFIENREQEQREIEKSRIEIERRQREWWNGEGRANLCSSIKWEEENDAFKKYIRKYKVCPKVLENINREGVSKKKK